MPNKKRRDLRILWSSNSVNTNSGYAVFSRDLLYRLLEDGWPVAMVGFFGAEGYYHYLHGEDLVPDRFKGLKLKVYPKMNDPYGSDALLEHSIDYGAHVAMTMVDLQTQNPGHIQELGRRGIKFIPYLPIDQDPPYDGILNNLNLCYKIITFSKYGQKVLQDKGYTSTLMVEGIDTKVFRPMNKMECRKKLQIPEDKFVFGMIGANKENPPRKGYQEAIEAFKMFVEKHPEAMMFFHTQQISPTGFPILEYGKYLGIHDKMLFLNPYRGSFKADSYEVAKEINTFDVLLHPSMTEGFGMLSIEAQSCGVPPIVNRCTSQPELIVEGVTGEICETGKPFWRAGNAYVYPADVNSLYDKMELLYSKVKDEKQRKKIAKNAREHIVRNYNIDVQIKDWIKYFEDLQEEIIPLQNAI